MIDLKGKVAIVTGASSGIGRASAKLFARAGAKVVVGARRKAELESLVREIADQGGSALALAGDVSEEAFAEELVERAERSYGRLDVAFNNAGILGERGPTTGISLKGWNETLKVNLTSAFLAAKHQIPAMLKQGKGSIIFTSTFVGYTVGFPGVAAYAASKSGLIGLTEVLAAEYGPQNIRVNAILPGAVEGAMYRTANETAEQQAHHEPACIEAHRVTRRAGAGGALSRLRCVEFPIRHRHAGGRWSVHHANLRPLRGRQRCGHEVRLRGGASASACLPIHFRRDTP